MWLILNLSADLGETTDEEILPLKTINRPQQRLGSGSSTPCLAPSRLAHRAPVARMGAARRQGPSLASWTIDPEKPFAVADKDGVTIVLYPPTRTSKALRATSGTGSTTSSFNASPTRTKAVWASDSENDRSDGSNQPMLLQSPANLMMSGFIGNQSVESLFSVATGPPEAFYPWRAVDAEGNMVEDDDEGDSDDNVELDIFDFIDISAVSDSETGSAKQEMPEKRRVKAYND